MGKITARVWLAMSAYFKQKYWTANALGRGICDLNIEYTLPGLKLGLCLPDNGLEIILINFELMQYQF